ncbi:sulfotransferase family protein [Desulfosoma sp.]|uniref:sulfotransferase family protein n=1 Tax=Desulfosoma sp. TaxID=2603217 RepID=UPI00404AB6CE
MLKRNQGTKNRGILVPNVMIVVGMPRSGTTWLAKMLDACPRVLYLHEPDSGSHTRGWPLFVEKRHIKEETKKLANRFFSELPWNASPRMYARPPFFPKTFLPHGGREILYFLSAIDKLFPSVSNRLAFKYFFTLQGPVHLLIKSVESFGRIPLFAEAVENLRLIHIVRHPGAVVNSIMKGEKLGRFKDNRSVADSTERLKALCSLKEAAEHGLSFTKLMCEHVVARMAWWWLISTEKSIKDCESLAQSKIVIYEELCSKPFEMMRDLYSWLGLEFHDRAIKYIKDMINTHSRRYYSVYRHPHQVANAWKKEMDRESIRMVEQVLSSSWLAELWN